jgi:charged multivesicular body protein 1
MGAKQSLEDDLITFRLTSKQMVRSSKKCEKNEQINKEKVKAAIQKGDREIAKIYAENTIREKNQAINFLRMASRVDAVSARLEAAIRMQQVSAAMGKTVKGMASVMKSMDVEKISKTMEEFEKQFENMDVIAGSMETTMQSTTAMSTPPEQVDALIQLVADEAGLMLGAEVDSAGMVGRTVPQVVAPQAAGYFCILQDFV